MLRCKKGDMAFDLNPNGHHYGQICTVGDFYGDTETVDQGFVRNAWWVSYVDGDWGQWIERDCMLLPIRPDELKETEEQTKEIENV